MGDLGQPEAGDDGECKQVRAHGAAPGSGTLDCSPPPCPGPNPGSHGPTSWPCAHRPRTWNRPEEAWSPWPGPLAPWAGRMRLAGWAGRPTPVLPCAQDSAHEQGAIEHHGWAFACPGQGDHAPSPGIRRRCCLQHVRNAVGARLSFRHCTRSATWEIRAAPYNPRFPLMSSTPMAQQTMKALVKREAAKGIWLEEVPVPTPGPNEVLIKLEKTAICGTDLHLPVGRVEPAHHQAGPDHRP